MAVRVEYAMLRCWIPRLPGHRSYLHAGILMFSNWQLRTQLAWFAIIPLSTETNERPLCALMSFLRETGFSSLLPKLMQRRQSSILLPAILPRTRLQAGCAAPASPCDRSGGGEAGDAGIVYGPAPVLSSRRFRRTAVNGFPGCRDFAVRQREFNRFVGDVE